MRKLVILALFVSSVIAQAATASTFTFDGYVTGSNDADVAVGAALSGTVTIDPENGWNQYAAPGTTTDFSSPEGWQITNPGDLNTSSIFVSIGSYQYTTGEELPTPTSEETIGFINGGPGSVDAYNAVAYGLCCVFAHDEIAFGATFAPNGTATLTPNDTGTGYVYDPFGNNINFTITSLAPVPLPASAWLLLSALGALGIARSYRTKAHQTLA